MSKDTLERLRAGELAGAQRLDLSADLEQFPPEIMALADTLEVLNLTGNRLSRLPADLGRLKRLRILFCSDNAFTCLPDVLGDCPALEMVGFKANRIVQVPASALPQRLRWLILTDNAIDAVPTALGERPALQKLMLAGNRLTGLPDSMAQASRLELLRLSANRMAQLPPWLTSLPRLCWLALSGNPLGWAPPAPAPLPTLPWSSVVQGERLGGGASGDIYRVAVGDRAMALKLFRGAVTSDGLPQDELAACLAAGSHPSLITPTDELAEHPQGKAGLFMPLLPAHSRVLADPPSFESCTRDVYAPDLQLSAAVTHRLLREVAAAVAHLHARGIMHGDLYAHNIHWHTDSGQAWLGDMGAASLLPHDAPSQAALLALEVRAFGCLMEELLARVAPSGGAAVSAQMSRWQALQAACMSPEPSQRPRMADVAAALA